MSLFDAIILGLLQGLTEFLPVSSSGHLVLTQAILNVNDPGVAFEVILHAASLLAILVYFRKRIFALILALFGKGEKEDRTIVLFLVIGTLPAVIAVLLFKDFFEEAFSNPVMTSVMLLVTGFILLMTRFIPKGNDKVSTKSTILMGLGQAMAIMPGISRSGSTIAVGMMSKVEPSKAAEFSFLLAIPAILGALVFKADDLTQLSSDMLGLYSISFITTFVSSLLAVYLVLSLIKKGKFEYFAYYCFAAGLFGLYLFL